MDELRNIRAFFTESMPVFNALGDEVRQKIILLLLDPEPKSVQQLADGTNMSRPSISHHLRILKDAGLVDEHKKGTRTYYQPCAGDHVSNIKKLLEEIDRLEKLKEGKL